MSAAATPPLTGGKTRAWSVTDDHRLARGARVSASKRLKGLPTMGLAWQQGPLAPGAIGTFLTSQPLPERLLFAEPLRRRMRVLYAGEWIADSDDVVLLHEPGRYPVAYFPRGDIRADLLAASDRLTEHPELGATAWYAVRHGDHEAARGAWEHTALPGHAVILADRLALAWHAMDAFYEEDERILGHAADAYHRIDIRQTTRDLTVHAADRLIAQTRRALVLYESGFASRWYVPRADVDAATLHPVNRQTFCPVQGPLQLLRHRRHSSGGLVLPRALPGARAATRDRRLELSHA
jgi:uncharacterized protein (DUF427 family)